MATKHLQHVHCGQQPAWLARVCVQISQNFKIQIWNMTEISKYNISFDIVKILKYINNFRVFQIFSNFGAKDLCVFWKFDAFSARFSGKAWKMLKNAALDVKIRVDTADILIFWVKSYFDISASIFWYFGPLPNWNQSWNISTQNSAPSGRLRPLLGREPRGRRKTFRRS